MGRCNQGGFCRQNDTETAKVVPSSQNLTGDFECVRGGAIWLVGYHVGTLALTFDFCSLPQPVGLGWANDRGFAPAAGGMLALSLSNDGIGATRLNDV